MSLSGPKTAWAWFPIKYFWRNLNMSVTPIQPDRAWEVKRGGEEWQIIAKCRCAKLVSSYPKRLEAVKVFQLSAELRVWILMQCTYFSVLLLIKWQNCRKCILWHLLWCMKCIDVEKTKDRNIKFENNKGVWILSQGTVFTGWITSHICILHLSPVIYNKVWHFIIGIYSNRRMTLINNQMWFSSTPIHPL